LGKESHIFKSNQLYSGNRYLVLSSVIVSHKTSFLVDEPIVFLRASLLAYYHSYQATATICLKLIIGVPYLLVPLLIQPLMIMEDFGFRAGFKPKRCVLIDENGAKRDPSISLKMCVFYPAPSKGWEPPFASK